MKGVAERALNAAQLQEASYADVRIAHQNTQSILVKNGHVEALSQDQNQGFGVRVVVNGAWGFASSSMLTLDEAAQVATRATQIARASSLVKTADVALGPPEVHVARYQTPVEIDPFSVPLEDTRGEPVAHVQHGARARILRDPQETSPDRPLGLLGAAFLEQEQLDAPSCRLPSPQARRQHARVVEHQQVTCP